MSESLFYGHLTKNLKLAILIITLNILYNTWECWVLQTGTSKLAHFFFKWQLVTHKPSISIHVEGQMNFKEVHLSHVAF